MKIRAALLATVASGLSLTAGYVGAGAIGVTPPGAPAEKRESSFAFHQAPELGVSATPVRSVSEPAGARLTFSVALENARNEPVDSVFSTRLVRDDGQEIAAASVAPVRSVGAGSRRMDELVTPLIRDDGYYQWHILAVAKGAQRETTGVHSVFLHMQDGSLSQIEPVDYYRDSRALVGKAVTQ